VLHKVLRDEVMANHHHKQLISLGLASEIQIICLLCVLFSKSPDLINSESQYELTFEMKVM
jgi:hypothetical protein